MPSVGHIQRQTSWSSYHLTNFLFLVFNRKSKLGSHYLTQVERVQEKQLENETDTICQEKLANLKNIETLSSHKISGIKLINLLILFLFIQYFAHFASMEVQNVGKLLS